MPIQPDGLAEYVGLPGHGPVAVSALSVPLAFLLLTNGLCRRDKRRAGTARPTFSPLEGNSRLSVLALASRRNPRYYGRF